MDSVVKVYTLFDVPHCRRVEHLIHRAQQMALWEQLFRAVGKLSPISIPGGTHGNVNEALKLTKVKLLSEVEENIRIFIIITAK